ncbi:MAG: hypothetical protein ABF652_10305 [Clostridium beijerinckii]
MKKNSFEDIEKMRKYVIQNLVTNYHYEDDNAKRVVLESTFNQLLEEDTDYVLHYTVDYWAKEVNNENTLMCV